MGAAAQTAEARSESSLVISGEVRIGEELAQGGTVVLHRVSAFFSGEVDSVAVGRDGSFEVAIPEVPAFAGGDVYFASTRYQGVLYFGGPVAQPADTDGTYLIRAYPTIGAGPQNRLAVRVRNTFLEPLEPGPGWAVTDLFEVENSLQATLIASEEGASWSHPLPPGAVDFEVGQSDLPPEAASFRGGTVHVSAPVPPGTSVYLFSYGIPADAFTLPLGPGTRSMELLFREPVGELTVGGLAEVGPVDMEGGTFRRFAGRDLASAVVDVRPGRPLTPARSVQLVAVLLAAALTVIGSLVALRAQRRPVAGAGARRRRVLVEIARLDERWSDGELEVEDYARRRLQLLEQLER